MGSLPESSNDLSNRETLERGLRQAHQEYSDLHPQSRKSYENACKYLPGGNTRTVLHTTPFPFTIASAYGCTLKTVDGLEYTDFLGDYTAGIYGHNNPIIRKASSISLV
jgi:glutamate-1-semialdehyde 2,1-aminomutase